MGARGPAPKRTDAKVRHVKQSEKPTQAPSGAPVVWPEPLSHWHPIATNWYLSLAKSGQAGFYQQSDADYAVYVAEGMSRSLGGNRMSGQMFAAITSAMSGLLVTEADRRRVKVELEQAIDPDADAEVIAFELYSNYE